GDIHGAKKTTVDTRADYQDIPKLEIPLGQVASKSLLEDGDVVFVDASEDDEGTSKHVVVVNKEKKPFISGLHTIVAKSKTDELAHEYRRYCFQTAAVRQQFLFYAVGTKVSGISKTNIAKLALRVPSLPEQTAIAAVLTDMDAELAALEQRREKVRALKQGMMQELLIGRTRLVSPETAATTVPFPKPVAVQTETRTPAHSWAFNEAVVISVLAAEFGKPDFPLGRMRYTKFAYLLHRHVEHRAEGYLKKAAGPYNPATRYAGPEKIAQENGYIKRHMRDQYDGYIAAGKIAEARNYFMNWYGQAALDWLQQFRFWKKEELERLATVDMAMEELRRKNRDVTLGEVKNLIATAPEWFPKLDRAAFSDELIAAAMTQCAQLFPGHVQAPPTP
ncbi:MAG TPA: restriction endonuclease subunit S, partial [Lacipirellulaceae bacterium]|nr:restriction endonuclease subunit S [Lacipirellulaceae bacterium]